jgi:hypothetical protein
MRCAALSESLFCHDVDVRNFWHSCVSKKKKQLGLEMYYWIWVVALFVGTFFWASVMSTAMGVPTATEDIYSIGVYLGIALPVFGITGIIAGITFYFTKAVKKSLWTWTILLLVGFAVLGIGVVKIVSSA